MIDISELKRLLLDIPDNATIYIEADHGQSPEQAHSIFVTDEEFADGEYPYYGEDIDWKDISECEKDKISAVKISY